MEYGIRSRVSEAGATSPASTSSGAGNGATSWLESAAAAVYGAHPLAAAVYPLPAAALILNSLHALQSNAAAAAMELVWKSGKREPPDDLDPDDEDEESTAEDGDKRKRKKRRRTRRRERGSGATSEEEPEADRAVEEEAEENRSVEENGSEEENDGSAGSWKDTQVPILSSWMLDAYTSMLGRLSAATATFEATDVGSNPTSDNESESDRSSYTDMLSRESSPISTSVRKQPCPRTANPPSRAKKKRPNNGSSKARTKANSNNDSKKESSEAANTDGSSTSSQGKKRSLALQRVRYRYEREEYRCSLCSYACTIEKAFQRHLRAHARGTATESRVSCAVCGADRSSEVDLSKHMRRHRDNRYFCCDICIFRTVQLKKLIQHRRMHTGEKPHLCPHCAYRSARRDNLRSHVRRVHKKENLYCDTFSPRGMFIAPKIQQSLDDQQQAQQSQDHQAEQPMLENDDEEEEEEEEDETESIASEPPSPSQQQQPSEPTTV